MADLIKYPLEDGFKTTLTQAWDGATWNINVWSTPSFTFPSWVTTYIVVNPWKSNIQIAEINAYSAVNGTMTVNDITLEKWASVNSTAQTHNVWSEVIISDNYQFWNDIATAINSKMNLSEDNVVTAGKTTYTSTTESQKWWQNVTTAQRTALTWVVNWDIVYDTDIWVNYQYIWGVWSTFATWSVVNASETEAGKVELPTTAEFEAWTDVWWTWASLSVSPSQVQSIKDWTDIWITWEMRLWTTNTAPTSWLISDWSAVSRTTYSVLFAVIWTTYWVWDWSTTFNLPNLAGNTPVGKDWATFTALWDTWGSETHTLTVDEIPAHTHTQYRTGVNWSGNSFACNDWAALDDATISTSTWGWAAHNNLQPYLVLNYIIKT